MKINTTLLTIVIILLGCSEYGPDVIHRLSSDKKILFVEGDILSYESDSQVEQFEVIKIVNGRYEQSRSGTCAKPRLDIYEYQAVYLKSVDSLSRNFRFTPVISTDCSQFPPFTARELICTLNGTYDEKSNDKLIWMDELAKLTFNYKANHKSVRLRNQVYKNALEYDVPNGKRLDKVFYTRRLGFVGYRLKNGALFTLRK